MMDDFVNVCIGDIVFPPDNKALLMTGWDCDLVGRKVRRHGLWDFVDRIDGIKYVIVDNFISVQGGFEINSETMFKNNIIGIKP